MPSGPTPSWTDEKTEAQREGGAVTSTLAFETLPSGAKSPKDTVGGRKEPASETRFRKANSQARSLDSNHAVGSLPHLETLLCDFGQVAVPL